MMNVPAPYRGLDRNVGARDQSIADLEALGLDGDS